MNEDRLVNFDLPIKTRFAESFLRDCSQRSLLRPTVWEKQSSKRFKRIIEVLILKHSHLKSKNLRRKHIFLFQCKCGVLDIITKVPKVIFNWKQPNTVFLRKIQRGIESRMTIISYRKKPNKERRIVWSSWFRSLFREFSFLRGFH